MRGRIRRSIVLTLVLAASLAAFLLYYPDSFRTGTLSRADGSLLRLSAWDTGWVDAVETGNGAVTLVGWAADRERRRPAGLVVVFLRGQEIAFGSPDLPRPDVVASTGSADLLRSGFRIPLPADAGLARREDIRAFAVLTPGTAGELRYGDGFRQPAR